MSGGFRRSHARGGAARLLKRRFQSRPSTPGQPAGAAATTSPEQTATPKDIQRLTALVRLLDEAFRIPGTPWRVGIDGLIGLVPGVGDLVGAALATYVLMESARLGVGRWTLARMAGNVALDFALGAFPLLGDVFDMAFKANRRNLRLLNAHLAKAS